MMMILKYRLCTIGLNDCMYNNTNYIFFGQCLVKGIYSNESPIGCMKVGPSAIPNLVFMKHASLNHDAASLFTIEFINSFL